MGLTADLLNSPYFTHGVCIAFILVFITAIWEEIIIEVPYSGIPVVGKCRWDILNRNAKTRFAKSARGILAGGFQKYDFFQVITNRALIILHPKYIEEIKNHPSLNFEQALQNNFFKNRIPGFEPFHIGAPSKIIGDTVRIKLTQALSSLSTPLMKEAAAALIHVFPPSGEWKSCNFYAKMPYIMARVSTLVFLGRRACRDEEWLNVAVHYTLDSFHGARRLRAWPAILRPFVHHFLPYMRRVRHDLLIGRGIVEREIRRRQATRNGKLPPEEKTHSDAVDWFNELSQSYHESFDIGCGQMGLSLAAVHTTSNLLTNIMFDLAAHPELVEPLRREIVGVFDKDGVLTKPSLVKLKLMDSVMKESQRMNPMAIISMNRFATNDIPLSDGNVIPKGAVVVVSAHVNNDESIYPNAAKYDGYRFYHKRKAPGHEYQHQFVKTTSESFGFGHGAHACPGRFFASSESKILLIHLLLMYDWKFKDDLKERPKNIENGFELVCDPSIELMFRSRVPEIDLSRIYG